ncbi:MAG TPA: class I adenylate-forming enzyme family protein [Kofleriaceae bacterium]|jgi:acyl-coenzyme A synthetase/AMP-(fatty) acid ligase
MKLGKRLRQHARVQPDARAVFVRERWWTYGELVRTGDAIARELGAESGDVVAIAISRGIEAVLAVCAVALAGAIPAMIDPDDGELAQRTVARLRPRVVLARDGVLPGATTLELADGVPAVVRGAAPSWEPIARPGLAFVIYTSGSTVDAKGVAWSETRVMFDWRANTPTRGQREHQRRAPGGIAVPLCTALGLQDLLRTLYDGMSTVLLDTPFRVGLEQARALGVWRLRLTPTHVDVLLATTLELPALRVVLVASAPIAPARLRALAKRVPGARVARSYGLTESGAATLVWLDRNPKRARTVGRAIAFRRITIRDPEGNVLPPRTWGEVAIDLPAWDRGDGYVDAPPELARRFANGTLFTGDRGALDARGFLVLGARHAEILKVGGRSVSAPHIEEVLGAGELAVVGAPDRALGEVACAMFVPGAEPGPDATAALRADEVPRWILPRVVLPRSASGKLRRGRLALEAARWSAAFPQIVAPDHRTYPAYTLDPRTAIVDGGLAPWFGDPGEPARAGRTIALVARRPFGVLALGYIQSGTPGAIACRFVAGPFATAQPDGELTNELLHVFAAELERLVALLPGPRMRALFVQEAGGWRVSAGEADAPMRALGDAALPAIARVAAAVQQLVVPGS